MANKIISKVMDAFCLNDSYDDEMEENEFEESTSIEDKIADFKKEDDLKSSSRSSRKDSRVVKLPVKSNMESMDEKQKVVIVRPFEFDETAGICDNLKDNKIVVVNTNSLDSKIAQRLLDFVGGATYVLNVQIREIDKGIYMFLPSNVDVSNTLKKEIQGKGVFNFMN
ncbi:cell division inhibitor SepF [Hathewaya proteolytica DSM 3090]|uniref:Cell division protein SepF n=1 Tax=Hathewaya proteolytica DSM 3090 TaxID=1121331 RepID=A0A1M6L6Y5_9CLOT|nr:cell division protein SepF [Hathewaya proteolytica]SHJ66942.1 cell division inhibitor SepF [Hathewaya proteolytica DSM 3090]